MLDFLLGSLSEPMQMRTAGAGVDAGSLARHALARSFAKRDRDPTLERCEATMPAPAIRFSSRCGRPCADGRRQAELPTGQRRLGL